MIWRRGRYEFRLVKNWPTLALSCQRWRYAPGEHDRAWMLRCRIGPLKLELVRWW